MNKAVLRKFIAGLSAISCALCLVSCAENDIPETEDEKGSVTEKIAEKVTEEYEEQERNIPDPEALKDNETEINYSDEDNNKAKTNDSEENESKSDEEISDINNIIYDSGNDTVSDSVYSVYMRSGIPEAGYVDLPEQFFEFISMDLGESVLNISHSTVNPVDGVTLQTVYDGSTDAEAFAAQSVEEMDKALKQQYGVETGFKTSEITLCQGKYKCTRYDYVVYGMMSYIICAFYGEDGNIHLIQIGTTGDSGFDTERVLESYSLTEWLKM